jgi:hypothetical protein
MDSICECHISSHRQPTRGSTAAWGLGRRPIIHHQAVCDNTSCTAKDSDGFFGVNRHK